MGVPKRGTEKGGQQMVNALEMKAARIRAGMTQEEIAQAVGISTSTYSDYERGKRDLPINVAVKFCEACGIDDLNARALIFLA